MSKEKQYRYSEIFWSFQGEGMYTGIPTAWLRFWGCNLECRGFGQENLDDPTTWELPYETFDPKNIIAMEDLPVWTKGCDSSYSWSSKYRKLAHLDTVPAIVDKLENCLRSDTNPNGKFIHETSGQHMHMAFTGGEPMMSQAAIVSIMKEFNNRNNMPHFVTVETNGTQELKEEFVEFITKLSIPKNFNGLKPERGPVEWFWSVSPKLRPSGEKWEDAIKPNVIEQYLEVSGDGQLKFVVNNDSRTWYEVDKCTKLFREVGCDWPVWIMPEGATKESQSTDDTVTIVMDAMSRGYYVAPRVHTYVFGNAIGT